MPLREDILNPISGDNPSGVDLRYDTHFLIYDKIQEARRKDDDLAQGDWKHERKAANYPLVVRLAEDALTSVSKDLQLAAWLTEALLHTEGFSGLRQGIDLCDQLMSKFWDTLYPVVEEDDRELRVRPLAWIGYMLELPIKCVPIVASGYDWLRYTESRAVGFEDQAKTDKDKKLRAKTIADGKLAPELFDKAFNETPKDFYLRSERDLDQCMETLKSFNSHCEERFGEDTPSFGKLESALEQVRRTVHNLLEKKRETEPDPVEVETSVVDIEVPALPSQGAYVSDTGNLSPQSPNFAEPVNRGDAAAAVAAIAVYLRRQEPYSPAPYLMMRGLRWGELRGAIPLADSTLLEAPPTELRQQIKRLALAKKWRDLLETAENAMALPCSRAWLDLQRLIVGACTALGGEFDAIGSAIQSELRALLNDLPQLLDATLLDDTPAANAETRAWLQELCRADRVTSKIEPRGDAQPFEHQRETTSWLTQAADAFLLAKDALKAGHEEKAFSIMRREIVRQHSGRGRFQRTMQLIELCAAAGKDAIAQPLLEDIEEAIEAHKLEAWEDPEVVAGALATIMKMSNKVQGSSSDEQKLFERICRLDPVQALSAR